MKYALIVLFSLLATLGSAQAPQDSSSFLPGISLNSWTQILVAKSAGNTPPGSTARSFQFPTNLEILKDRRSAPAIFADLMERLNNTNLVGASRAETAQNFANLAKGIEDMRQLYRNAGGVPTKQRNILYMLQILSEEVAYVGSQKFPNNFPAVIQTSDLSLESQQAAAASPRSNQFFGFRVVTGDIVLSKAVGSVSSELIAFLMKSRHIFSHAAVVEVTPQTNALVSPEALIQDGVKLRLMAPEYETNPPVKSRVYIYRYVSANNTEAKERADIEAHVDQYIQSMYKTVKNPFTQPVAGYDISMDPMNQKNQYFCVSIIMKVLGNYSPWAQSLWSKVATRSQRLLAALGISQERIPAPGDMELDPNYELVGSVVNVRALPRERIEAALADYLLDYFGSNRANELLKTLASLRTVKWTPQQMAALEQAHVLPQKQLQTLQKLAHELPPGLSPSQAGLFYFLDNVLTPEVEAKVQTQIGSNIVGYDTLSGIVSQAVTEIWQEKLAGLEKILNKSCQSQLQPAL